MQNIKKQNIKIQNGLQWVINLFGHKESKRVCEAWKEVFNLDNENTKIILQDLSSYCNVTKSSFVVNDAHQTAFNEGARDVFLHILEMANISMAEVINSSTINPHNNIYRD